MLYLAVSTVLYFKPSPSPFTGVRVPLAVAVLKQTLVTFYQVLGSCGGFSRKFCGQGGQGGQSDRENVWF